MEMCRCEDVKIWRCVEGKMCRCEDVLMKLLKGFYGSNFVHVQMINLSIVASVICHPQILQGTLTQANSTILFYSKFIVTVKMTFSIYAAILMVGVAI